jgi:hypothetical protein
MKRNLITSAALALSLTSVTLPSHAFDLFGLLSKNDLNDMLPYVPADTAVFFGGTANADLLDQMDGWLDASTANSASKQLSDLMGDVPESPGLAFFNQFMEDYYAAAGESYEELYATYGFKKDGASVFYLDGLFPVFRIALDDVDAFNQALTSTAESTGYEFSERTIAKQTVKTFELVAEEELTVSLGVLTHNDTLTLTAYTNLDDDAALAKRFALDKADQAISKADWKALGDAYDFDEQLRGYISLIELAKVALTTEGAASQQLAALLPNDAFDFDFSDTCRAETINMITGSPRVVFGTHALSMDGNVMDIDMTAALEIANEPVLTDLQKLVGFVPSYVTEQDNLSIGMAVGLNVDNLVPALTSLWTQFTTAEFECDVLVGAQEQVLALNPAMLSMATGFAKGVQGFSAGVFDLDVAEAMENFSFDAIVTMSAENPSVIASLLTSYVPFLEGQSIPTTGEPVELPLPLPIPVETFVAIKDKHLVVYTGETAKAVSEALASEPLEVNGLSAITVDYQKLGDLMMNGASSFAQMGEDTDCTELYSSAVMLSTLDMRISGGDTVTDQGLVSRYSIQMDPSTALEASALDLTGTYQLEMLDYDCSWFPLGEEQLNEDGTGQYSEMDEAGSCNVFESRYDWEYGLNMMVQSNSSNMYRDSCEDEWYEDEPFDFQCMVTAVDGNQFYCLETGEEEQTLYRYTLQ